VLWLLLAMWLIFFSILTFREVNEWLIDHRKVKLTLKNEGVNNFQPSSGIKMFVSYILKKKFILKLVQYYIFTPAPPKKNFSCKTE